MAHGALVIALLLMGAGLKLVVAHASKGLVASEMWLLSGALSAAFFILLTIRMTHRYVLTMLPKYYNSHLAWLAEPYRF